MLRRDGAGGMRRLIPVAILLLALTACGAQTVEGIPEAASAGVGKTADPCVSATSACTYVGQADIDGDGVVDQIGVGVDGAGHSVVRVAVLGQVQEISGPPRTNLNALTDPEELYIGAYQFSRSAGADIVLYIESGQGQLEQFLVVTWIDGAPALLPPIPGLYNGRNDAGDVWRLQSSHGARQEVACKGAGVATLEKVYFPTMEGMPQAKADSRDIQKFTFGDGAWQAVGALENVPDMFDSGAPASTEAFQCSDETVPPN